MQSRFAPLGRTQAITLICALLMTIGVGFIPPQSTGTSAPKLVTAPQIANADLLLYRSINARVAAGEAYYNVAAEELRQGNYPLKPFVTFRLPTLAHIIGTIGPVASVGLLWTLVAVTLLAWWRRLDGAFDDPGRRITGVMLVAAGAAIAFQPKYAVMHELWAGLLLTLALAVRQPRRWWWAVIAASAALMIRELALPFVLLMAAFATFEKRWRELAAWAILVAVFVVIMLFHAENISTVVRQSDPASPGWFSIGGWQAFLRSMRMTSAIRVLPEWIGNIGVVLSIFGWISWRSATGLFGALLLVGYAVIFMILGRAENFYWGLLIAPLLLLGLAFLPRAFIDLRTAMRPT